MKFAPILMLLSLAFQHAVSAQLIPLRHNQQDLRVDLGVGLWAWPIPLDFDRDGDFDLLVSCPDKPYNGLYFFENTSGDTSKNASPVFAAAKRIGRGLQNVQMSFHDGLPVVMTPGNTYPDFNNTGLESPVALSVPPLPKVGKTRGNMWRWADLDGDQVDDLVVGLGSWQKYGWDDAYNPSGEWTNGPLEGWVYWARNNGTQEEPQFQAFQQLMAGEQPVQVYGWPSPNLADFDGDGDLDLLCGEFLDRFRYFENIGTGKEPKFAAGHFLRDSRGQTLRMDLQMITPVAIDWDQDGDWDLIVGDEDGRVAWLNNTGKLTEEGRPQFESPQYFQQQADQLKFGALSTPWAFDWDGDGDEDLLAGNTAGYIGFFENLGGKGSETRWAAPQRLQAAGKTIRIQAGENGSIQGPAEAKWGYTTLSVADWDGDSLPDLLVNSIWGKVIWYRNMGTRQRPALEAARPLEVRWGSEPPELGYGWLKAEGNQLLTQWRTTPVAIDWDRDGAMDLVMLDHEGYLSVYYRDREEPDFLLPPRRVFMNQDGQPLRLNDKAAGKSGRRKLCVVDWDGDGKRDLLVNSSNANLLQQTKFESGQWYFKDMGPLAEQQISSHTTSPATIDLNQNGIPDLIVGAEDGHFYYWQR